MSSVGKSKETLWYADNSCAEKIAYFKDRYKIKRGAQ